MEGKHIPYIIAARLTQPLQRTIYQACGWWALEGGVELTEFRYQAAGWTTARRLIVVRQSVKRKTAPGKTLSLFADDAITQVIEELDDGERLLGRPSRIDEELNPAAQAGRLMRVAHETSFGRRFFDRAAARSSASLRRQESPLIGMISA